MLTLAAAAAPVSRIGTRGTMLFWIEPIWPAPIQYANINSIVSPVLPHHDFPDAGKLSLCCRKDPWRRTPNKLISYILPMARICIVAPCFNETDNVQPLYQRLNAVWQGIPQHEFELLFIDNASTDNTVAAIKLLCAADRRVKLICNMRNFGHIRSPAHGMLQAAGDAIITMASDLQDPPELIPEFVQHWEAGNLMVAATKASSQETWLFAAVRGAYYRWLGRIADVKVIPHFTGFGLYDRKVIEMLRQLDDPYPYVRGLISELGITPARVPYTKPLRKRGISKNNFYTLYDIAMLGMTSHSKVPLRLATMAGFVLGFGSLLVAVGYLLAKLLFWQSFSLGMAPLVIGVFFFGAVQLFFIGLLGEYINAIHSHVLKRPLVIERERINFDDPGKP